MKDSLEEAAKNYAEEYKGEEQDPWFDFMEGAKWQQERSYNEEDMEIAFGTMSTNWICFDEFIEQFKKK